MDTQSNSSESQSKTENNNMVALFSPASPSDFDTAKELLESASIQYEIKTKLSGKYYMGPRVELGAVTTIWVRKEDKERAKSVCLSLLKSVSKKRKKESTIVERIMEFLRIV